MTVPETVVHKTQTELFAFLWKNKKENKKASCLPANIRGRSKLY